MTFDTIIDAVKNLWPLLAALGGVLGLALWAAADKRYPRKQQLDDHLDQEFGKMGDKLDGISRDLGELSRTQQAHDNRIHTLETTDRLRWDHVAGKLDEIANHTSQIAVLGTEVRQNTKRLDRFEEKMEK